LAKVIKFIVAEGRAYVNFNIMYHNGINFTKKREYDILTYIVELVLLTIPAAAFLQLGLEEI
jgi:hypothetical protein